MTRPAPLQNNSADGKARTRQQRGISSLRGAEPRIQSADHHCTRTARPDRRHDGDVKIDVIQLREKERAEKKHQCDKQSQSANQPELLFHRRRFLQKRQYNVLRQSPRRGKNPRVIRRKHQHDGKDTEDRQQRPRQHGPHRHRKPCLIIQCAEFPLASPFFSTRNCLAFSM